MAKEVKETTEVKKARKPREKTRSVEELITLPVNKMTDKEKAKLIKTLKEANTLLSNKIDAFKQNSETAFAQARAKEEDFDAMEKYYREQLRYIKNQLNAFGAAVDQVMKTGGIQ